MVVAAICQVLAYPIEILRLHEICSFGTDIYWDQAPQMRIAPASKSRVSPVSAVANRVLVSRVHGK